MQSPSIAKRRLPAWLLWTAPLPLLIAIGWAAAVLYVQRQIHRDLAEIRGSYQTPTPTLAYSMIAVTRIQLHGCRALPALVEELRPELAPDYAELLGSLIHTALLSSHFSERGTPRAYEIIQRMNAMRVESTDPPEERKAKIEALHAWWRENGGDYHQGWRFWSTTCRAPLSKDF